MKQRQERLKLLMELSEKFERYFAILARNRIRSQGGSFRNVFLQCRIGVARGEDREACNQRTRSPRWSFVTGGCQVHTVARDAARVAVALLLTYGGNGQGPESATR